MTSVFLCVCSPKRRASSLVSFFFSPIAAWIPDHRVWTGQVTQRGKLSSCVSEGTMVGGEPRAVTISSARESVCVHWMRRAWRLTSETWPVLREDGVNDLVIPHPWLPSRQGKAEQSSRGGPRLMCKAPVASVSPWSPSLVALFQDGTEERGCSAHSWRSSGVWVGEDGALRKETSGTERRPWEYRRVP